MEGRFWRSDVVFLFCFGCFVFCSFFATLLLSNISGQKRQAKEQNQSYNNNNNNDNDNDNNDNDNNDSSKNAFHYYTCVVLAAGIGWGRVTNAPLP